MDGVGGDVNDELEQPTEGTAQDPRTLPWRANAGGARTLDAAIAFARARGIDIPDDVRFFVAPDGLLPTNAYAKYCEVNSHKSYSWEDFLGRPDRDGNRRVPIKVHASVLESDEAIVAVLAHELFEIQALRELFDDQQGIEGITICRLICTGVKGNLHDRAWDRADELVTALRSERKEEAGDERG